MEIIMLIEIYPHKAQYLQGEAVCLVIHIAVKEHTFIRVEIYQLGKLIKTFVKLSEDCLNIIFKPNTLNDIDGFLVEAKLFQGEQVLGYTYTAFDVVKTWELAPRYGFLSDFSEEQDTDETKIRILNQYHINIIQFYDWMYRHHQFTTDLEVYKDPMGKKIKQSVLKNQIKHLHLYGMKALAYGAVYGAQKEYVDVHPEQTIRGISNQPIKFIDQIYFMDIHRDNPWHGHILKQFKDTILYGFDGIHLDQYGFPKEAISSDGIVRRLRDDFPVLIHDVKKMLPNSVFIFNAVNNFPIETVAGTAQDCIYIEVWPPNETYYDLYLLIKNAKTLNPMKQVILSAYLHPFNKESKYTIKEAENGAFLAMASIFASGGFHLLIGEGNSLLTGAYYSDYYKMQDEIFIEKMHRYYDFITAYGLFLYSLDIIDLTSTYTGKGNGEYLFCQSDSRIEEESMSHLGNQNFSHSDIFSIKADAGKIWTLVKEMPGYKIIHLINFVGLENVNWNEGKSALPKPCEKIEAELSIVEQVKRIFVISPDVRHGMAEDVTYWHNSKEKVCFNIPKLYIWTMAVIETEVDK